MKTKKRVIISLSVAIAVLLIAVVAIFAVNAAANQNITSKIKVNYRPSEHVHGNVSVTYTFGDKTHKMTTNGNNANNGNDHVFFVPSDKPKNQTLQMQNADLDNGVLVVDDLNEIILTFNFKNTGYVDFVAYLDVNSVTTDNNIVLSYSIDGDNWTKRIPEIVVETPGLLKKSEVNCFVKISVNNAAFDARFEGAFIWDLVAEEDY